MLIINVKEEGGIERALKSLKKKFAKNKTLRELRDRESFTKPSVQRRDTVKRATHREELRRSTEE